MWKTNALVLRLSINKNIKQASNVFYLRFWMQLIHNPDTLFDVQCHSFLAGSLSVIGQTLMDIFIQSEIPLSKESPSSKLLFAREISKYRCCFCFRKSSYFTDKVPTDCHADVPTCGQPAQHSLRAVLRPRQFLC